MIQLQNLELVFGYTETQIKRGWKDRQTWKLKYLLTSKALRGVLLERS